jgi:hypothetical protein
MSSSTKFGSAQREALIVKLHDAGSTRKEIVEALEAKGCSTKLATSHITMWAEENKITFRGQGAQGWRERMMFEFEANPDFSSKEFRKILDTEFSTMKESRRVEYTRYFFPMMSQLRKMKAS